MSSEVRRYLSFHTLEAMTQRRKVDIPPYSITTGHKGDKVAGK